MTSFDELVARKVRVLRAGEQINIAQDTVCIAKNLEGKTTVTIQPHISFSLFLFDELSESEVHSQLTVLHGVGSQSDITRYSILGDNGMLESQMTLSIENGAHDASAAYLHRVLMLWDTAHVICRPELVIFHDAVMGKHGATISSVPESEAEYLAARGISSQNIKKMYATIFESQLCDLVLMK